MLVLKLCIILYGCEVLHARVMSTAERTRRGSGDPPSSFYTWMGLLMTKDSVPAEQQSSTLVVLVLEGVAVGVARDVRDRDPESTEVMFWGADGGSWLCGVDKFEVPPGGRGRGQSTLALVHLIPPLTYFLYLPIAWPMSNMAPALASIVGLDQENGTIHHIQKQVVICDRNSCDANYDSIETSPSGTSPPQSCYRELPPRVACPHRAGMALVSTSRGSTTLFAIGVGGEGCSSCSRWLNFHPLREWVRRGARPARQGVPPYPPPPPKAQDDKGMYDYYDDMDLKLMRNVYDKTIEVKYATRYEELGTDCTSKTMVYHEKAHYITCLRDTTGYYALSLFDHHNPVYDCASLCLTCKRSAISWWITNGFEQEDVEFYVKKVPQPYYNGSIGPKVVFLLDRYRKYHQIKVAHIAFKFKFDLEAVLEVKYYGNSSSTTPKTF